MNKQRQAGFTIVELMISTAVFAVVLLIITAGVISFTNRYYKGIVSNTTQNAARNAMNELSQAVQFSRAQVTPLPSGLADIKGYCVNSKPYYFVLGKQLGDGGGTDESPHALVTENAACGAVKNIKSADVFNAMNGARELLGDNMRVTRLEITPGSDGQPTSLSMQVTYGDRDLLCRPSVPSGAGFCNSPTTLVSNAQLLDNIGGMQCRSGSGSQYCAVSTLNAKVSKRLQ